MKCKRLGALATGLNPVFRKLLLIGIAILLFSSLLADTTTPSRLNRVVTLTLGDHQVVLEAGTVVTVLRHEGENTVISFKLGDGSPVIAQIPAAALTELSAPKVIPAPGAIAIANSSAHSTDSRSTTSDPLPTEPTSDDDTIAPLADLNPDQVRPSSSVTLSPEDIALPPSRFTALNGSFYITIRQRPVLVLYSLPMEGERLAKSASNLVFYGTYPNELPDLNKENIVPEIVTKLGCAVFSFSFNTNDEELSNPTTAYWSKDSGFFEAVLAARDEIIKGFALDRKKLLLMGYSGGGGMALNLAGAFPDQVDAVATGGANVFPELETKNSVSWLIINNRGDANASVTLPFYKRLKELGCSALYCESTPARGRGDYHAPSQEVFDLIYTFLAGILEQRNRMEEGTQDLAKLWPYAADSDPLKRYALIRTLDLDDPISTNVHYDLLPSAAFAWNWCQVCPPMQTVRFSETGTAARLNVNFPATDKPIGVVLYYDKPDYRHVARQVEDVSYLAEHGCMVISPPFGMSPERFAQAASDWITSQDNLAAMPIHFAGYGEEGARFLACMNDQTKLSCKSITLVSLHTFPLPKDVGDKIESLAKGCGLYSFFCCKETVASTTLDALSQDLVTYESRSRGCQNVIVNGDDDSEEDRSNLEQQAVDIIKQTVVTSCGNIVPQESGLWLENLVLPDQATTNNQVDIKVQIRDRGIYGQQGIVQLKSLGTVLSSTRLSFNFDGEQEVTLSYVPTESGDIPLEIVVSSQDSSTISSQLTGKLIVK